MKRRILSTITALALIWSLCPTWAFAAEPEADTGLCPHHPEHTAECGYIPPTEGQPCAHVCTAESGCITLDLDCRHAHDETCGYVQADPGAPCAYICNLCPIEDLIAALPRRVTADNAAEVQAQLDEILALYRELTEEEQDQIDLSRCYELQEALDAASAPELLAEGEVSYVDADGSTKECTEYTQLTQELLDEKGGTLDGGWYVVSGSVSTGLITFTGEAHLILTDDCSLTACILATKDLTIYGQSGGSGSLTAKASRAADYALNSDGTITINGGRITATATMDAAIGGKAEANGTVVINGGTVNAATSNEGGAGCGAALGGGAGGSGTVTINGGTVNASSKIGSGAGIIASGAAIGGGWGINTSLGGGGATKMGTGTVTINGGTVSAENDSEYLAAIGGSVLSTVTISGSIVKAWNSSGGLFGDRNGNNDGTFSECIVFSNGAGRVYDSVTLNQIIEFGDVSESLDSLHIPYGASLSGPGKLTGNGTFTTENLIADMIQVPSKLYDEMTLEELKKTVTIKNPEICGQTFTVTGWDLAVTPKEGEENTYIAAYTRGSNTVTKEFTLLKPPPITTKTVTYLNGNNEEQTVEAYVISGDYSDRIENLKDGCWYVVEDTAARKQISSPGGANVILADGCNLTAGMSVQGALNIYAQSNPGGQWDLERQVVQFGGIRCGGSLTVYGGDIYNGGISIHPGGRMTIQDG